MATSFTSVIDIDVSEFKTTKQQKLLKMLNDKRVQKQANEILKDYINHFVPKHHGALRRSAVATYESISWGHGLAYGIYQYEGEIYGKNYPIIRGGRIVGWYSKPGVKKHPTGRKTQPYDPANEWKGWPFGYTTPGTGHHWDRLFNKDRRWKAKANIEITRYLKRECKERGLNT